jgi:chaperonin cofactor prefoldin
LRQWDKAAIDAKECIRLDPSFVKGYYRLASAQAELQDFDGAMATIRQGLGIDTSNQQLIKQMRLVQQQKKVAQAKSASESSMLEAMKNAPGGGAHVLDSATAMELQELQVQYTRTSREMQTVQVNLNKTQRGYQVSELTSQELSTSIPDPANCYRSVGKMFLQSSKAGCLQHLNSAMEMQRKIEEDLTKQIEYLDRQMKSQRQNMDELVGSGGGGGAVAMSM